MAERFKIIAADAYGVNPGDLSWGPVESLGLFTAYPNISVGELPCICGDADALMVNRLRIGAVELDMMPRLKYIGTFSTGTDFIDKEECRRRGITVSNIPAYSTDSVAQMTWALILELTSAPAYFNSLSHSGMWSGQDGFDYSSFAPRELSGGRIGIVGLGAIGSRVAAIAQAFGMHVAAFTSKRADQLPPGIEKADLRSLMSDSDVVSIHCPLSPATKGLISRELIALMKPDAILVNTARGAVVDEQALAEALDCGRIRGAAVDVLSTEPPSGDCALLRARNCLVTPHVAWATRQARVRAIALAAANLKSFIEGRRAQTASE